MLKFVLTVSVGAAFYWLLTIASLPYAGVLLPSVSGLSPFMVYVVMHLTSWAMLVAVSIPVALVLANARLSLHRPVLTGFLIALVGLVTPVALQASFPAWVGPEVRWSHAADLATFALTLPLLTWLARSWLPSNSSPRPTPLRDAA